MKFEISKNENFREIWHGTNFGKTLDLTDNVEGTVLYADDTTIITENDDIKTLEKDSNTKLNLAVDWFRANKLTLNEKKNKNNEYHIKQKRHKHTIIH